MDYWQIFVATIYHHTHTHTPQEIPDRQYDIRTTQHNPTTRLLWHSRPYWYNTRVGHGRTSECPMFTNNFCPTLGWNIVVSTHHTTDRIIDSITTTTSTTTTVTNAYWYIGKISRYSCEKSYVRTLINIRHTLLYPAFPPRDTGLAKYVVTIIITHPTSHRRSSTDTTHE